MAFKDYLEQYRQTADTHTAAGKPRALYTLRVSYLNRGKFTHRSDHARIKYAAQNIVLPNELEALKLKFAQQMHLIKEAQLFDNQAAKGEQLLLHFLDGRFLIDRIP